MRSVPSGTGEDQDRLTHRVGWAGLRGAVGSSSACGGDPDFETRVARHPGDRVYVVLAGEDVDVGAVHDVQRLSVRWVHEDLGAVAEVAELGVEVATLTTVKVPRTHPTLVSEVPTRSRYLQA
jgi:hypothetical protein